MKNVSVWTVATVLLLLATLAQAQFYVGYAQEDISPTDEQMRRGEVWLGGYGFWKLRGRPQGVHDPVYARSTVIAVNETVLTTTVIDAIGISNRILHSIRSAVSAEIDIPVDNVIVSATHSHSAPDFQGLWGFVSDDYKQQIIDQTVNSIVTAYHNRVPARLYVSLGTGFANNRRDWGYTDTDLIVLDARDYTTNERISAIVNFAAHPVCLGSDNKLVSSDYVHYVREYVESHLKAPVAYFSGAIGDVSPDKGGYSEFEGAQWYGESLGAIALESMAEQVEVTPFLKVENYNYTHPVTNPMFLLAFAIEMLDYDVNEDNSINTRATYFRLGTELQGVAFPGESLTRNGLAVKEAMTTKHKLFLGLASDTLGYFVPSDEWRTGRHDNYEENVSIHKMVGDNTRDILVNLIEKDNF